ncbi:PREDICTED: protein NEN2-like [Camelina sativa]|uniref:Protein NEN2-like n=1 Tax=Camelina sativa TaxID=90675 RepID=A0ABM0X5H7_CAMSA|nr:PREDICTED: protein NEN2-like [Camelina sativa]
MSDDQDQFITFFDFKVDGSGITQLHVNQVTPRKLYSVTSVWSLLRPIKNDEPPVKNIPDVVNTFPEFAEVSDCAYHMLDGHIWIGHDIIRSDYPRLKKAFAEIDKDPPVPKDIIDIRHFLMSGTKLAGLADILGLGHPEQEKYPTLVNVRAIKLCEEAMSIYEPDMLKNYVDGHFHPVVSLLRDFADGWNAVAATRELLLSPYPPSMMKPLKVFDFIYTRRLMNLIG